MGSSAGLFSSPSDSPLSGTLCSPEPFSALPGSGLCQSLGRWGAQERGLPSYHTLSVFREGFDPDLSRAICVLAAGRCSH